MSSPASEQESRRDEARRMPGQAVWPVVASALAIAVFALSAAVMPLSNNDVWIHLTTGELILSEGVVPTSDRYTFTTEGTRYVAHEWLAAVAYALGEGRGGEWGVVIVGKILPVLAILAALALATRASGASWGVALPGILISFVVVHRRILARPELLAIPLLIATLWLLWRDRSAHPKSAGRRNWALAALLPIHVLWANIHGSYVLGILLVLIFAAVEVAELWLLRRTRESNRLAGLAAVAGFGTAGFVATLDPPAFGLPAGAGIALFSGLLAWDGWRPIFAERSDAQRQGTLRLLGFAALLLVGVLANPRGFEIYLFPFEFSTGENLITSTVNEWRPLLDAVQLQDSLRLPAWWLYCALWLGAISVAALRRRLGLLELTLFTVFALLPLRHVRWLGLSALLLAPVLAAVLTSARKDGPARNPETRLPAALLATVASALFALSAVTIFASAPDPWFRLAGCAIALVAGVALTCAWKPVLSPLWPALAAGIAATGLAAIAQAPGYPEWAQIRLPPWLGEGRRSFGPSLQGRRATDFLQGEGTRGRLLTQYEWAGYAIFATWPEVKVFLDSRSEVHGEALLAAFRKMKVDAEAARSGLEEHAVDLLLLRRTPFGQNSSVAGLLEVGESDDHWQLLYLDDLSVLFGRPVAGRSLPAPLAKTALLDFQVGAVGEGAMELEGQARQALARAPHSAYLRTILGDALRLQGKRKEALQQLALAWGSSRRAAIAAQLAGRVAASLQRPHDARLWYQRAQAAAPSWDQPRLALQALDRSAQ